MKNITNIQLIEAKKTSGLFCAFMLCVIVSVQTLCMGNGLIQGYSTLEKITIIAIYLITGSVGYSIGYFVPLLYNWFSTKK